TLATNDSLQFNNSLFATFEVRGGRRILTLVDDPKDADYWNQVFKVSKEFQGEVRTVAQARDLSPLQDLPKYQAICLLNVNRPDRALWEKLKTYVDNGGGLAIVPGELNRDAYNEEPAKTLLPAQFKNLITITMPEGSASSGYQGPITRLERLLDKFFLPGARKRHHGLRCRQRRERELQFLLGSNDQHCAARHAAGSDVYLARPRLESERRARAARRG